MLKEGRLGTRREKLSGVYFEQLYCSRYNGDGIVGPPGIVVGTMPFVGGLSKKAVGRGRLTKAVERMETGRLRV